VLIIQLKVSFKSSKIVAVTIGQVAKGSGFTASAIRFYEEAGVLPKAVRIGGRRQYDASILETLAVLDRAKACGFSLADTRQLFYGFRHESPPSERWRTLARRKLVELDEMLCKIVAIKELLERSCECKNLRECGRRILASKRDGVRK
jgi:MerR family redox-sensitive transcriptional activator SoxR